jgi:asparagine synthase (glutamine-hydrolysing)
MEAVANDGKESIISGEGADELFGGYNSYKEETRHGGYMKLPYFIRHFIYLVTKWIPSPKLDFFARRGQRLKDYHIGLDRVFKDRDALAVIKEKKCVTTKEITAEYYEEYKDQSTMKQRQAIDFYFWLINDFVHCVAKSADRFGIESRFPLLGSEVVNIAVQLPDEFKLKDGMTKALFRKAARKAIPTDAHSRKKLGFPVPLKDWIRRDDFYENIKAKFQSETANKFFDTRAILKLLDDHKKGEKDCYKKVWTIYTFLVWYDLNFNA